MKQACKNVQVSGDDDDDDSPQPSPRVSVVIDANPSVIFEGESSKLTWNSTNASKCVASGGWTGTKALDGSETVRPNKTTTYTITCSNAHDTASDAVTVTVKEKQPDPDPEPEPEPEPKLPIVDLSANPQNIDRGESSQLTWTSRHATKCIASGSSEFSGQVALNGNKVVNPNNTTTYTIVCSNSAGSDQDSATVFVRIPEPQPNKPTVTLVANPSVIDRGESSVLTWNSTNADTCVASGSSQFNGNVSVDGNRTVSPIVTTDYTIVCSNSAGSASDHARVTVRDIQQELPTVDITANPLVIDEGETSVLTWNSNNADTCVASGDWSGALVLDGSRSVQLFETSTFIITCSNERGSDTDSVTVTVIEDDDDEGDAPRVDLRADETSIEEGDSTTLRWDTDNNPDICVASNDENDDDFEGTVDEDGGSESISPNETTTYRITCSNDHCSDSDYVTVHVDDDDDDDDDDDFERVRVELEANPNVVRTGEAVALRWNSTNADFCRASGGWSGILPEDGTRIVFPFTDTTYLITCFNDDDSDSDSDRVNVEERPVVVPPILNLRLFLQSSHLPHDRQWL
jgi:hypothetical protein